MAMIILSHPSVNAYTRNIAAAFAEAEMLAEFHTSLAFEEGGMMLAHAPGSVRRELARRELPRSLWPSVRRHPWREAGRLISERLGVRTLNRHETGMCSVDAVFGAHDAAVARHIRRVPADAAAAVYCGEDGALETFRAARSRGWRCIYDLPIAYHRSIQRLIVAERERLPEFAGTLQGIADSPAKLERKVAEAQAADVIVACSEFVAASLRAEGFGEERIAVVPYGAPSHILPRSWSRADLSRPLRLLFAGAVGQRKGVGDLLQAVKQLQRPDVQLTLMGSYVGNAEKVLAPWRVFFRYEPPRPHEAVLDLMRTCDVLVLPSVAEGFALVIAEAMACGLPVLVTPNTGAAPAVRDGREGFFVPCGDPDALADRIAWFADHREAIPTMGAAARARGEEYSWTRFRSGIVAAARRALAGPPAAGADR